MFTVKHAVFAISLAASSYASAKHDDPPPPVSGPSWIEIFSPSVSGFTVGSQTVTYGPVAAAQVWVYDGANPPNDQGLASIESLVESKFNLPSSGAGSLSLTSSGDLSSVKSGSFKVDSSYNYLAVHYGQGELLFHFNQPIASNMDFIFANLPHGISNYRAFSSISAVPEPGTYSMLLAGLGLMGVLARRRARR